MIDTVDGYTRGLTYAGEHLNLIGHQSSPECYALRTFLIRNQVPFLWIEVDTNPLVNFFTGGTLPANVQWPVCLFPDGTVLQAPTRLELARKIGLHTRPLLPEYDLAIIGAGPAGLTAAVYAASEGLRTVVVEREAPGGQAGTSSRIENYPGFPEGISGMELTDRALEQAQRFGAEVILVNEVAGISKNNRAPFVSYLLDGAELRCHTKIIATGAVYQRLEVPGIDRLSGRGVYYGTALSAAPVYEGKDVFIVGGGNSAGQTALHLSQFARSVTLLIRSDTLQLSMSQYLIDRLETLENVEVWFHTQVLRVEGEEQLTSLVLDRHGTEEAVAADALFILIGQRPATQWTGNLLAHDQRGFLLTGEALISTDQGRQLSSCLGRMPLPLETSAPGVFAAGDVRQGSMNRVAWAIGDGALAVQQVHRYLGTYLASDLQAMRAVSVHPGPRIDLPIPDRE